MTARARCWTADRVWQARLIAAGQVDWFRDSGFVPGDAMTAIGRVPLPEHDWSDVRDALTAAWLRLGERGEAA